MTPESLSRRQLLAGVATVGAASVTGLTGLTSGGREFTHATRIESGSIDGLVLDWRETYNGAVLTDTVGGTATPSPDGPVIALGNVLPGDSGTLSIRLRIATDGDDATPSLAPDLAIRLEGHPDSPGLDEYIDAALWYDTGLLDVGAFGAKNGERDVGERLVHPDAEGTLGEVAAALSEGITLDARPAVPGTSCLSGNRSVTITLGWQFPIGRDDVNAVQGQTIDFDLQFEAEQC